MASHPRRPALIKLRTAAAQEKTLHANMCGHTGVRHFEADAGNSFSPDT